MKSYKKSIELDVSVSKESLKDIDKELKKNKINYSMDEKSKKDLVELRDTLKQFKSMSVIDTKQMTDISKQAFKLKEAQSTLSQLTKTLEMLSSVSGEAADTIRDKLNAQIKEQQEILGMSDDELVDTEESSWKEDLKSTLKQGLSSVFSSAWDKLKSTLSDAWKELGTVLDASLLSNSSTRETAFTYGFNAAETYGWQSAMTNLGFESIEDLMYANTTQQELFNEQFKEFSSRYSELYDAGFFDELLKFDAEIAAMQQELNLEVGQFFVDNKDTIMKAMQMLITLAEVTLDFFGWMLDSNGQTSDYNRTAETKEIINSYGGSNSMTVNQSNSFTNVTKENQSWISNAGTFSYEQLKAFLGV